MFVVDLTWSDWSWSTSSTSAVEVVQVSLGAAGGCKAKVLVIVVRPLPVERGQFGVSLEELVRSGFKFTFRRLGFTSGIDRSPLLTRW